MPVSLNIFPFCSVNIIVLGELVFGQMVASITEYTACYSLILCIPVCAETGSLPGMPVTDELDEDVPTTTDAQQIRQSVENLMLDLTLCEEDGDVDTEPGFKPYHTMPSLRSPGPKQPVQCLFTKQAVVPMPPIHKRKSTNTSSGEPGVDCRWQPPNASPDEVFMSSVCAPVCGRPTAYSDPPPLNQPGKPPAGGPSVCSVESPGLNRCLSLNDVNTVEPFLENELAQQDRVLSWINCHSQDFGEDSHRPPTPPPRTHASHRSMHRQTSEPNTDHAYCNSHRLTQSSRDVRKTQSMSHTDPPPYVPPPSYASFKSIYYAKPEASAVIDFAQPTPWYKCEAGQQSASSFDTPASDLSNTNSRPNNQSSSLHRCHTFVRQSSARLANSERPRLLKDSERALSKSTASLSVSYRMAMGDQELTPDGTSVFNVHTDNHKSSKTLAILHIIMSGITTIVWKCFIVKDK